MGIGSDDLAELVFPERLPVFLGDHLEQPALSRQALRVAVAVFFRSQNAKLDPQRIQYFGERLGGRLHSRVIRGVIAHEPQHVHRLAGLTENIHFGLDARRPVGSFARRFAHWVAVALRVCQRSLQLTGDVSRQQQFLFHAGHQRGGDGNLCWAECSAGVAGHTHPHTVRLHHLFEDVCPQHADHFRGRELHDVPERARPATRAALQAFSKPFAIFELNQVSQKGFTDGWAEGGQGDLQWTPPMSLCLTMRIVGAIDVHTLIM